MQCTFYIFHKRVSTKLFRNFESINFYGLFWESSSWNEVPNLQGFVISWYKGYISACLGIYLLVICFVFHYIVKVNFNIIISSSSSPTLGLERKFTLRKIFGTRPCHPGTWRWWCWRLTSPLSHSQIFLDNGNQKEIQNPLHPPPTHPPPHSPTHN